MMKSAAEDKHEWRVRRKKEPCQHAEAKFDGNYDWPGVRCVKCGEQVKETDYE